MIKAPVVKDFQNETIFQPGQSIPVKAKEGWLLIIEPKNKLNKYEKIYPLIFSLAVYAGECMGQTNGQNGLNQLCNIYQEATKVLNCVKSVDDSRDALTKLEN